MILNALNLVLQLVLLTTPDGQSVAINPDEVVSVRPPSPGHHAHIKCVIYTSDGKFTAVREDCATVNHKLDLP
jgi:hypothetical protein